MISVNQDHPLTTLASSPAPWEASDLLEDGHVRHLQDRAHPTRAFGVAEESRSHPHGPEDLLAPRGLDT
jgi:hypothetical protein